MHETSNVGSGTVFGRLVQAASRPVVFQDDPAIARRAASPRWRLPPAIAERVRGPGGYYNLGNALGLVMGIAVQMASVPEAATGLRDYFLGSPSAFAMTAATAIFITSGEAYHRGARDGRPDRRLYRIADLLSGVGALALGCALLMLGHPLLAWSSGLLGAAGKLGSAAFPTSPAPGRLWPSTWPDPFRSAVVVSRVPALIALVVEFWATVGAARAGGPLLAVVTPATLLICYALWTRADLMLFESDRPGPDAPTAKPAGAAAISE